MKSILFCLSLVTFSLNCFAITKPPSHVLSSPTKLRLPIWHCGMDSKLVGSTVKAYDYGKDTFIGTDKFICVNYKDNLIVESNESYEVRMEGDLKTGFNSYDEIELKITNFKNSIPKSFTQKYSQLLIYSDFPIGDYISIYVMAIPDNLQNERIILTINTPIRLANDVKDFVENAFLTINKTDVHLANK